MEEEIAKITRLIATIEEMQSELPDNTMAWEVLNNLKYNYNNRIKHLKRLQREEELKGKNPNS